MRSDPFEVLESKSEEGLIDMRPPDETALADSLKQHPEYRLPETLLDFYRLCNGFEAGEIFDFFRLQDIRDARKLEPGYLEYLFQDQVPEDLVLLIGEAHHNDGFLLYWPEKGMFQLVTGPGPIEFGADVGGMLNDLCERYAFDEVYFDRWITEGTKESTRLAGPCNFPPAMQVVYKRWTIYACRDNMGRPNLMSNRFSSDMGVAEFIKLPHARIVQLTPLGEHLLVFLEDASRALLFVTHCQQELLRRENDFGSGDVQLLKEFTERDSPYPARFLSACGDHAYFNIHRTDGKEELWKTDGTSAGTLLVSKIAGLAGVAPVFYQNKVCFFVAKRRAKRKKKRPSKKS